MTPHPSRWSFASDAVRAELGESPETLFESGEEVKANPVRRVVRSGGYFRRGAARFRSEWKSAKLLESQGIPVVEYLACGESSRGGCLITRALPDSESVAEYYWRTFVRGGADPEPFLALFAPFLKHILESGLFHPDFHLGNILYDKVKRSFVLVDALGVRRRFSGPAVPSLPHAAGGHGAARNPEPGTDDRFSVGVRHPERRRFLRPCTGPRSRCALAGMAETPPPDSGRISEVHP